MNLKLALGTAQFGLDYGINKKEKILKKEVFKILKYAIQNGIDVLDTAYVYGDSEKVIGQFIKENKANFKIISKAPSNNLENIENFFHESLKRLNLNKMYGYLIHDFKSFLKKPEIWSILEKIKAQGKVKKIGFSLYHPKEIEYLLERNIQLDIIQVPFSVFDQRFSKIFSLLKEKGIEVYARSMFLQGLVFKNPDELKGNFVKIKNKLLFLRALSKERNISFSAMFIGFVVSNGFVDKGIIGIDSVEHLKENIEALKDETMVNQIYNKLLRLKEDDENVILPINWK